MPTRKRRRPYNKLADFKKSLKENPDYPVILSEGDSWFALPTRMNVIDHLCRIGKYNLFRIEHSGDEILSILSGKQKRTLRKILKEFNFDFILFSGGGNDIVGEEFASLLKKIYPGDPWQKALNKSRFKRRLAQIKLAYQDLIDMRNDIVPHAKIITHAYDYPIPSNKGIRILGKNIFGPWMKPYMKKAGIVNQADQNALAKELIDQFHKTINSLEQHNKNFIVLDTLGTLLNNEWGDEIHPTRPGFIKIARMFKEEIGKT